MNTSLNADVCDQISAEEFNRDYFGKKPLVMRGMTDHWKARNWTPEYFAETFGDAPVFVELKTVVSDDPAIPAEIVRRKTTMAEYANAIRGGEPNCGYMSVYPIMAQFPALQSHIDFPRFGWSESDTWNEFFLGPKGTRAPLHYDTLENLFCQLYGRKSFLVISPEFHDHCYPVNEDWQDGYSQIDIKAPDLAKFPRFAEVRAAEVILGPGDLLYVPARWWHSVQSLDVSISINQWFCTEAFAKAHADKLYDPEAYGPYAYPIDESMKRYHD